MTVERMKMSESLGTSVVYNHVTFYRPILMEKPDIVVGTPSRVLAHLTAQNMTLSSSLETLVIDEADLLFSFGFENDLKSLLW